MAGSTINEWALKYYKALTMHTVLSISDELEARIAGTRSPRVLSSIEEAYALASRFKNVLYRYPYFKKKHQRILWAIVDRCGEAYHTRDLSKLYITKDVINEWSQVFSIPQERISEYLRPLFLYNILESSNKEGSIYKINDNFYRMTGPIAQYLVEPTDTRKFVDAMAALSGLSSIYVMTASVRLGGNLEERSIIPWFVKLPMIYTLSGLNSETLKIEDFLDFKKVNAVDNYFVIIKGRPVEWWRSIRTEAFGFMADNAIIEQPTPNGYKLNKLWVRMHEEGVRRYIKRIRERYERIFRF